MKISEALKCPPFILLMPVAVAGALSWGLALGGNSGEVTLLSSHGLKHRYDNMKQKAKKGQCMSGHFSPRTLNHNVSAKEDLFDWHKSMGIKRREANEWSMSSSIEAVVISSQSEADNTSSSSGPELGVSGGGIADCGGGGGAEEGSGIVILTITFSSHCTQACRVLQFWHQCRYSNITLFGEDSY